MIQGKDILYGGLGLLVVFLGIGMARRKVGSAITKGALKSADENHSPSWFALRFKQAFEWGRDTGGTDEELIMGTLSAIPTQKVWGQVQKKYSQIASQSSFRSLIQDLDGELDSGEYKVASAIFEAYPKDDKARKNRWGNPQWDDIRLALRSVAMRLFFYLHRGDGFSMSSLLSIPTLLSEVTGGSSLEDQYWQKSLEAWDEIPLAGYAPHLARVYQEETQESLFQVLLDKLSDEHWNQLHHNLTNKADGKGKQLREIFGY